MESSPRVIAHTPSPRSLSSNNSSTVTYNKAAAVAASNSDQPITRSEPNNPYPTTFVQADTASFKKVVQMLTGAPETVNRRQDPARPGPIRKEQQHKPPPASKLYERRSSFKTISPMGQARAGVSSSGWIRPELLSPSLLDFPSLALSPVTPLIPDPFKRAGSGLDSEAEEKAIKEKGFYLHNSPRDSEPPRLLPLFPLTSPRVVREGSSSSSTDDNRGDAKR